jgi:hypothetical protein
MQKRRIELEQHIFTKALRIIPQENMKKYYKHLVREKKFSPSQAILELTKDIDAQPRALELLELLEYYDWDVSYWFNQYVDEEASSRIFSYYLEKYNERAKVLLNPNQMNGDMKTILNTFKKHLTSCFFRCCHR